MEEDSLIQTMGGIGYHLIARKENPLPNGKKLVQLDFGCSTINSNARKSIFKKGKTEEWHYYISSRRLTASELLHHVRMEWPVEIMHRLLDVHFGEDYCRVEDRNIQQNLNMLRKTALNLIQQHKGRTRSKRSKSKIMFDCLLNPYSI